MYKPLSSFSFFLAVCCTSYGTTEDSVDVVVMLIGGNLTESVLLSIEVEVNDTGKMDTGLCT